MKVSRIPSTIKVLLVDGATPHSVALGAALGIFLTLTPTFGIQMAIAAVVGTFIGANRPLAMAIVWLSNPLTILPLYYSFYATGAAILGSRSWGFHQFTDQFQQIGDLGLSQVAEVFGWQVVWPVLVGSMVLAPIGGVMTYLAVFALAHRLAPKGPRAPTPDADLDVSVQPVEVAVDDR